MIPLQLVRNQQQNMNHLVQVRQKSWTSSHLDLRTKITHLVLSLRNILHLFTLLQVTAYHRLYLVVVLLQLLVKQLHVFGPPLSLQKQIVLLVSVELWVFVRLVLLETKRPLQDILLTFHYLFLKLFSPLGQYSQNRRVPHVKNLSLNLLVRI